MYKITFDFTLTEKKWDADYFGDILRGMGALRRQVEEVPTPRITRLGDYPDLLWLTPPAVQKQYNCGGGWHFD